MPQLAAPIRAMLGRIGPRWRFLVVIGGLFLVFGSIAVTMHNQESWQAQRHYREAVADADRLDPHWRLDDILARRETARPGELGTQGARDRQEASAHGRVARSTPCRP